MNTGEVFVPCKFNFFEVKFSQAIIDSEVQMEILDNRHLQTIFRTKIHFKTMQDFSRMGSSERVIRLMRCTL